MLDPYIGQINAVGFTFAPRNWAMCLGQLMEISEYQALFSLLGTNYGGDGRSTFGLPDLRGRTPVGVGHGPTTTIDWSYGSMYGSEFQALSVNEMPSHTHTAAFTPTGGGGSIDVEFHASTDEGTDPTPSAGAFLADVQAGGGAADKPEKIYRSDSGSGTVPLGGVVVSGGGGGGGVVQVGHTGNGQHFPIIQPGLGMAHCIAMDGQYPPRN